MYTPVALTEFAVHVMPNTIHTEICPAVDKKAPTTTAVSAGTGGKMFSTAARTPITVYTAPGGKATNASMTSWRRSGTAEGRDRKNH